MKAPISAPASDRTRTFYEDLVNGKVTRSLWGKHRRFNSTAIAAKSSVKKHFVPFVARHVTGTDRVLDLGCGPGGFMLATAPLCRELVGADITPSFVEVANQSLAAAGLTNAKAELIEPGRIPFGDGTFDCILMVDTIHHLEDARVTMEDVHRVLRPGGTLLIFEPNKRNPALWLMCLLDSNEHGLLRLGTFSKYKALLQDNYQVVESSYNGLLIGPEGKLSEAIADAVASPKASQWLGWLSPKLFIAAQKLA